jgi:Protein phosphatase 2C
MPSEGCATLLEDALAETALVVRNMVLESDHNEVATALLLTLVTDEWLATVQVGDGATVCRSASGELTVVMCSWNLCFDAFRWA